MKVGTGELLIVLAVIILLFGARKLPDLARSLGTSAREFRKGVAEGDEEDADGSAAAEADTPEADTPKADTPEDKTPS